MTNHMAMEPICHPGYNWRRIARQRRESIVRDATGDKPRGKRVNQSSRMQPETNREARKVNLSSRTQPMKNSKAKERIYHSEWNWRQIARRTRESVTGTQPETNREARERICHPGCKKRQTTRHERQICDLGRNLRQTARQRSESVI